MVGNYQNNLSGSAVEFLKHGWDFFFPQDTFFVKETDSGKID